MHKKSVGQIRQTEKEDALPPIKRHEASMTLFETSSNDRIGQASSLSSVTFK
jgi:hypothetical protein